MKKTVYRLILKLIGWKITGNKTLSKDTIKKAVIITVPHTHWLDFYLGILIRGSIGFKSNYLAKKELFIFPLNIILRWTGGVPVDRKSSNNLVKQIVNIFNSKDEFRLSLAPEGTRKKVEKLKSGFYYIALESKVPIFLMTLDFKNKKTLISEPFYPSGNKESEFNYIESYFHGVVGKVKEYSFYKKN